MADLGRILVGLGLVLAAAGAVLLLLDRFGGLGGLGHLPGDFVIERRGFRLYLPLGTSLLLSVLLSLLLSLLRR